MSAFEQLPLPDAGTPIYNATLIEHVRAAEFYHWKPRILLGAWQEGVSA